MESADDRFRNLTVGHTLLDALTRRLDAAERPAASVTPDPVPASGVAPEGARSILDEVLAEGSEAQQQQARELLERCPGS